MVLDNLYFFDKFGENYNFQKDLTNQFWYGREYIKPVSVGLFDSRQLFIIEKDEILITGVPASYERTRPDFNVEVLAFTLGQNTIQLLSDTPDVVIGATVTGAGIGNNTTIVNKNGKILSLSRPTTGSGGGGLQLLTFNQPYDYIDLQTVDTNIYPGCLVTGTDLKPGTEITSIIGTRVFISKQPDDDNLSDLVTFSTASKNDGKYFFPMLAKNERLVFRWETEDKENCFFLYKFNRNANPDADTTLPVIEKIDKLIINHSEFYSGNRQDRPGNIQLPQDNYDFLKVSIPLQVNVAFSPVNEKIYERKLICYKEEIAPGAVSKIIGQEGTPKPNIQLPTKYYYDISCQTVTGSGTGLILNVFRNDTQYIILDIVNPGVGYEIGDTVKISGGLLDGDNIIHDLTFKIATVDSVGVANSTKILEIDYYGEGLDEDERFKVWLENFGISFHTEDAQLLKQYDIKEGLPDWKMINLARKQLLVNRDQVLPYVGTYKGLINFIKLFNYGEDLKVKEFWKNINVNSAAKDQFALVDISDLLDDGKIDNMEYVSKGGDVLNSDQFVKTEFLALCYEFTKPSGKFDDDGIPEVIETSEFTPAEIFYKLFGLSKKIKREILPINVIIRDIIGEFIFFEKFNLRYWTDDVVSVGVDINYKFNSQVTLPDNSIAVANIRDIRPLYPSTQAELDNPTKILSGFPKYSFNTGSVVPYSNLQKYGPTLQTQLIKAVETFYTQVKNEEWKNHGNFYYWAEGNVNIKEQIGCPIILEAILPLYKLSDYDGVTFESLSDESTLTLRDLAQYLNLVDIEWSINKPAPNPYSWNFRGSIYDFRKIAHILPYIGEYLIETKIYDQFAGISVDYVKFEVKPTVASVAGYARTTDKFSYKFSDLFNVTIGDLADSKIFNPGVTIPSFTQKINLLNLEKELFDWNYIANKFSGNTSPLDAKIKDTISGEFKSIEDPTLNSNNAKNWGIANDSLKLRLSDVSDAQLGELFHTKFYQLAYQSDFLQGFTISEEQIKSPVSQILPFSINLGLYDPFEIPENNNGTAWTLETLAQFLNTSTHPAISKFTYKVISTGEIGGFENNEVITAQADPVVGAANRIILTTANLNIKPGALVNSTTPGLVEEGTTVQTIFGNNFLLSKNLITPIPSTAIFVFSQYNNVSIVSGVRLADTGSFTNVLQTQTDGIGKNAAFSITGAVQDATKYVVNVVRRGKRYRAGDIIKIDGESVGGFSGTNDIELVVNSTIRKIYASAKVSSDDNNFRVNLNVNSEGASSIVRKTWVAHAILVLRGGSFNTQDEWLTGNTLANIITTNPNFEQVENLAPRAENWTRGLYASSLDTVNNISPDYTFVDGAGYDVLKELKHYYKFTQKTVANSFISNRNPEIKIFRASTEESDGWFLIMVEFDSYGSELDSYSRFINEYETISIPTTISYPLTYGSNLTVNYLPNAISVPVPMIFNPALDILPIGSTVSSLTGPAESIIQEEFSIPISWI